MAGMRDKVIHEYFGVDLKRVWKTVNNDLPALKPLFVKILDENFEKTESVFDTMKKTDTADLRDHKDRCL